MFEWHLRQCSSSGRYGGVGQSVLCQTTASARGAQRASFIVAVLFSHSELGWLSPAAGPTTSLFCCALDCNCLLCLAVLPLLQVYREAVASERCSVVHLTRVEADLPCDTHFPDITAEGEQGI
jgi:hypothetical protein